VAEAVGNRALSTGHHGAAILDRAMTERLCLASDGARRRGWRL